LQGIKGDNMRFINKVKNFLGVDIKEDKYKKADDKLFGKVSSAKSQTSGLEVLVGIVVLDVDFILG